MKKLLALSALMAALTSVNAMAVDANLNFIGEVTSGTCVLNAADTTKNMVIPDIGAAALQTMGASSYDSVNATSSINISGCPGSVSNISAFVTSPQPEQTGFGKYITPDGTAKNINLAMRLGQDNITNKVDTNVTGQEAKNIGVLSGGKTSIPVLVGVTSNGNLATAGNYNASYNVAFNWN